MKVNKKNLSYI